MAKAVYEDGHIGVNTCVHLLPPQKSWRGSILYSCVTLLKTTVFMLGGGALT